MLQKYKIKYIKDDSEIISVGRLFRRTTGEKWQVNLQLNPRHERSYLSLSQAPILVRHRRINATHDYDKRGYRKSIQLPDSRDWMVCDIGDCPAVSRNRLSHDGLSQKCFLFYAQERTQIYLPQFELARVLFFHDAYLARTSMHPEVLQLEFEMVPDVEEDAVLINISDAAKLPVEAFHNPDRRRQIGWVLLDAGARASFESINRYQMLDGQNLGGYRRWNFQFDPPPLQGVWLETRGWYDQASNSMIINEIDAVFDISHNVPQKLEFFSPRFAEQVQGTGSGGTAPPTSPNGDDEIKDGEESDSDTKTTLIEVPPVRISFLNPFETTKLYKKKRPSSGGRKDDEIEDPKDNGLSTEEGNETGDVPSADWELTEDMSDDSHLYISKFEAFFQMLVILENKHGCQILSKQIRKLPKIGRCKRHIMTTDGSPRCMAVVTIGVAKSRFVLLEVDTSDCASSLSTKVVSIDKIVSWQQLLPEIEELLLKSSLTWPAEFFDLKFGETGHKAVSHPQLKDVCKVIEIDALGRWAERAKSRLLENRYLG